LYFAYAALGTVIAYFADLPAAITTIAGRAARDEERIWGLQYVSMVMS
jgi:hypothetical protein